ncbi:MAG: anthranilate phosphoribosyltransferase [Fimbriimonadaceae bacterium]|nr:anthranilate phosphoribosyltransferase [Fimbriimonadaceae bacterium]
MTPVARLEHLLQGQDLTREQASDALRFLLDGDTSEVQRAGLLCAWRAKGASGQELAGLVDAAVASMHRINLGDDEVVDTCGTGGGPSTLNLSTGACVIAAAAGVKVAKHGNRSVSSRVGSADIIEAWGVPLGDDDQSVIDRFRRAGIAFLFAPHHHAAFRAVGPVRKELGVRTVFNLVGPLSNPAGAKRRLIGVYDRAFLDPMAEALVALGVERAYVVHGEDGLDEISPSAPTHFRRIDGREIISGIWSPADFGIEPLPLSEYRGHDQVEPAAAALMSAMTGGRGSEALIPNVAVTLMLGKIVATTQEGAATAREVIASGAANAVVARMRGEAA